MYYKAHKGEWENDSIEKFFIIQLYLFGTC